MKAQHTPGPWTCSEIHPDNGRIQIGSPKDFIAEIINYGPENGEDQNNNEQEANARLIAASPRMFKALQLIVSNWERGDLAEAVREGAEAIKQALGA